MPDLTTVVPAFDVESIEATPDEQLRKLQQPPGPSSRASTSTSGFIATVPKGHDPIALRELFSPGFLDWTTTIDREVDFGASDRQLYFIWHLRELHPRRARARPRQRRQPLPPRPLRARGGRRSDLPDGPLVRRHGALPVQPGRGPPASRERSGSEDRTRSGGFPRSYLSAKPGSPGRMISKLSRSPMTFGVIATTWRDLPSAMTASASAIAGQLLEMLDRRERELELVPAVLGERLAGPIQRASSISTPIRLRLAVGRGEGDVEAGVEADRDLARGDPARPGKQRLGRRAARTPPRRARGPRRSGGRARRARRPIRSTRPPRDRRPSTAPPGKTQTPGMKRASVPRRSISISRPRSAVPAAAPEHDHGGRGTGRYGLLIHDPSTLR